MRYLVALGMHISSFKPHLSVDGPVGVIANHLPVVKTALSLSLLSHLC